LARLVVSISVAVVLLSIASRVDVQASHFVNLTNVYTSDRCDDKPGFVNQFFQGIPTDPSPDLNSLGVCSGNPYHHWYVWADYSVTMTTWVYIGVWDWSRGLWVADHMEYRSPGGYYWVSTLDPDWTDFKSLPECDSSSRTSFSRCADAYEVRAYYWNGSTWVFQDNAKGLVSADWDISGDDDCCHFHWSPNVYDRPAKVNSYTDPQGRSFVEVEWRVAYYDGMPASEGTARLNRLKSWAGALQLEMRRGTSSGAISDGWDAAAGDGFSPLCNWATLWPWSTNIPGFQVTNFQIEESHELSYQCPGQDEEVQGKSTSESSWNPTSISDASASLNSGYWYWRQTFLRRTANQGQSFRLQNEFELNEDGRYPPVTDTSFDNVVATQRQETY